MLKEIKIPERWFIENERKWAIHTKRNISSSTSMSYLFHIHILLHMSLYFFGKENSIMSQSDRKYNVMRNQNLLQPYFALIVCMAKFSSILKNLFSSDKSTYDMETAKIIRELSSCIAVAAIKIWTFLWYFKRNFFWV